MTSGSNPAPASPSIGFVDAGRLGASLAKALGRADFPVVAVSRRSRPDAVSLAARIGRDAIGTDDPAEVLAAVDIVFLTCVDDRIAELARTLAFRPDQVVLHCSGATPVSALDPAAESGARIGGFHPLQTFPDENGEDRFRGVTFGVESDDSSLLTWLEGLANRLGGTSVRLDAASRPLYHASAVMVGPLTSALAGLAAELWEALGQDREAGVRALAPLLEATARHVSEHGLPAALTGPYARGDMGPVRSHVEALGSFRPETLQAYAALARAQLPIAAERGNIPEDRMRELRTLLEEALGAPRS
ncbi:MAG: DUF2520 domain-containing protein [Gemmatimonadota bacterium]